MRDYRKDEALRWLAQAEEEFNDAKLLKEMRRFYLSLFLCQQSAEKALKAYIYTFEGEPFFTHSVSVLLKIATELDPEFSALKDAKRLDDYYIPTHYPNSLPGEIPARYYDDESEAEQALELANNIIKLVKSKIL